MIDIKIIERKADINKVNELSNKYNISKDIVSFLLGRNVPENIIPLLVTKNEIDLLPYDSLTNVKKAASIIAKHIKNDSNIFIYGDYDADGINATYIMYQALVELIEANPQYNSSVYYHLPNRNEGYGLNIDWCKTIPTNNSLVITVDNGITKREEVEYLKANNIEVLITDHHKPQKGMIPDCTIVDAHLYDTDNINACGLCGAAVAFKVIAQLYEEYGYDYSYIKKYVAHVGIATITDVMPFTEENVIFISNTLKYINDYPYNNEEYAPVTESIYYYAESNKGSKVTSKDIAFGFGPQINSCGRMGDIQVAMDFMLATDEEELSNVFKTMYQLNNDRKNKTSLNIVTIQPPKLTDLALIIKLNDIEGIAGSIASNLCEQYNMPVIVFNDGDKILSGSARCPECYDIQWLLNNTDHVLTFGGHASAAGLNIEAKDFKIFKDSFNKAVSKAPVSVSVNDTVYVDKILTSSDLNKYTITQYDNVLFFNEFTRPVYALENICINGYHLSKNNPNNICFHIKTKTKEVKVWCWGYKDKYKALGEPGLVNIIGSLEVFNGMFVINILDIEAV